MELLDVTFELLRFEINETELSSSVKNSITPNLLPALFRLSKKHDIAHLIADALDKNGYIKENSRARELFLKERNLAVCRYEQQQFEFEQICSAFEKAEIEYIPLKGSVIKNYYNPAWKRTSCDIDILVKEEKLTRAIKTLKESFGYTVLKEKGYHDVSLFAPSGVHLELHFSLKQAYDKLDKVLEKVWEHCVLAEGQGYRYNLSKEFLYFHIMSHTAYHLILGGGCGIRPLIDLFILESVGYDNEKVSNLCKQCGLKTFYEKVRDLALCCMQGARLTKEQKILLEYIANADMYGDVLNRVAIKQVKSKGKARWLFSRLFLPYSQLVLIYPKLKNRKILFPFYQIARWFNLLFGKRSKNFKKELNASLSVKDKDVEMAKKVLSILEL